MVGVEIDVASGGSDTGRVDSVRFGIILLGAIELGAPASAGFEGQVESGELVVECPARGVDGCGVAQRLLGLLLDFRMAEFGGGEGALSEIAGFAGQGEVADAVGAVAGFGEDVLDLERNVLFMAVGAGALPFVQKILANFIPM